MGPNVNKGGKAANIGCHVKYLRPKKIICVSGNLLKKFGSVGRKMFYFYNLFYSYFILTEDQLSQ